MLDKQNKANRLAAEFEAYLKETLILLARVKKWEGENNLPLYLREPYAFYQTKLLDTETLLMIAKEEGEQTAATIAKQMLKVREKWKHELIFVNEAVSSVNRNRMVAQRLPFVIPGNQMYLPMLGVDLREHFRKIQTSRTVFSPSTQVLVLDAIYNPTDATFTTGEMAKKFDYSTMTMTRVFSELEQAGLVEYKFKGKARLVWFAEKSHALWELALPFLKSPVKKKIHVVSLKKRNSKVLSGLSALAEYSNLSEPETAVFAIDSDEWKRIQKNEIQVATISHGSEEAEIELWFYPPALFARTGIADPLSVYLSLKESGDERIQAALEELLKGMSW